MRNLTAVGKFLTLMVIISSVVGCSNHNTAYQTSTIQNSVSGPYTASGSAITLGYNLLNDKYYSLTDVQKQKQTMAVYSALESDYGQIFHWYESNAKGGVKAVHGYPMGSGFCRVLYSTIVKNGKQRSFEETACKEAGHDGWRFIYS